MRFTGAEKPWCDDRNVVMDLADIALPSKPVAG